MRFQKIAAIAAGLTAVAAVLAPPAYAGTPAGGCWRVAVPEIDLDGDGNPDVRTPRPGALVCVHVDSGLYDPVSFTCYGGVHSCDLRVTAGHGGSGEADAVVCVEEEPGAQPLCTTVDSGTLPLIPVEPRTICVGWSLTTSCMHDSQ